MTAKHPSVPGTVLHVGPWQGPPPWFLLPDSHTLPPQPASAGRPHRLLPLNRPQLNSSSPCKLAPPHSFHFSNFSSSQRPGVIPECFPLCALDILPQHKIPLKYWRVKEETLKLHSKSLGWQESSSFAKSDFVSQDNFFTLEDTHCNGASDFSP